jgi:hypothetical protein
MPLARLLIGGAGQAGEARARKAQDSHFQRTTDAQLYCASRIPLVAAPNAILSDQISLNYSTFLIVKRTIIDQDLSNISGEVCAARCSANDRRGVPEVLIVDHDVGVPGLAFRGWRQTTFSTI